MNLRLHWKSYQYGGPKCVVVYIHPSDLLGCPVPKYLKEYLLELEEEDQVISVVKLFNEDTGIRRRVPTEAAKEVELYVERLLTCGAKTSVLLALADNVQYAKGAYNY